LLVFPLSTRMTVLQTDLLQVVAYWHILQCQRDLQCACNLMWPLQHTWAQLHHKLLLEYLADGHPEAAEDMSTLGALCSAIDQAHFRNASIQGSEPLHPPKRTWTTAPFCRRRSAVPVGAVVGSK
jgi:hypothetical protein